MISKAIKATSVAVIVGIAGYWYWSPFLTVRQLQAAAQNRDADAFNKHVDYPKLRESIKSQYSERLEDKLGNPADSDNEFAKIAVAFGNMIGKAVVSPIVDALVRPETIMQAMQYGELSITVKDNHPADVPAQSAGIPDNQASAKSKKEDGKVKWSYERKGVNQVIAYATDLNKMDEQNQDKFGLVLQRSGFATWTLTEVRLPALTK